jgi:hypothetical protein
MGQQQLLLIILGFVIVGVAVVLGVGMFQDNKDGWDCNRRRSAWSRQSRDERWDIPAV